MQKYIVAHLGAGGVPIAVPAVCCQKVSPNAKILFCMTISSAVMIAVGLIFDFSTQSLLSLFVCKNRVKTGSAWPRCIFVYIAVASIVKNCVDWGKVYLLSSVATVNKLEAMYGRCGSNFFSSTSSHFARPY